MVFGCLVDIIYYGRVYSYQMMGNHVELISKHTTTILYTIRPSDVCAYKKTQYSQSHTHPRRIVYKCIRTHIHTSLSHTRATRRTNVYILYNNIMNCYDRHGENEGLQLGCGFFSSQLPPRGVLPSPAAAA